MILNKRLKNALRDSHQCGRKYNVNLFKMTFSFHVLLSHVRPSSKLLAALRRAPAVFTAKADLHVTLQSSGVSRPRISGRANCLILVEKHYFVWKNASQSTKRLYVLKILGAWHLCPPGYAYAS